MWPGWRDALFNFLSLHWFSNTVDTGVLELSLEVSPGRTGGSLICKLTTGLEAKLEDRPAKANRCLNLWQAPLPRLSCCPGSVFPPPQSSSVSLAAALPAPVTSPALAQWNEETAGVIIVPLFEGCPNEKQTNKSGEFHVSFKCTEMQLLSGVGDQRRLLNSGHQSVLPCLILGGDLLENFRRKLQKRIKSIKLVWIVNSS